MATTTKKSTTGTKTSTKKATAKLTPFEQETIEVIKQINEYKLAAEANVVSIIYKNPDVLRESNLKLEEFGNNCWRVFFTIANDLIMVEKKNTLDRTTVGFYLEKHKKLLAKYEEYGEYDTIEAAMTYVKTENFEGYMRDLRKNNCLIKLAKLGFPISKEKLSDFQDMTAEEIYDEYNAYLNDTFVNIDQDVKSYDISDGIDELIEELDQGLAIGLPYNNMPILTKETGGLYLGSITLVGGLSNVGKSTFARTAILPSIIKNKERIVIMLNEDGLKKWQRELLVFVANNIIGFDLQKHVVRDGKYEANVKQTLKDAAQWIKEQTKNHIITVVPFQKYETEKAIKVIRKFSSMGVKQFLLDTYKMDAGKVTDNSWLEMQQNMVLINDVIKPEANNLHIMITFQLAKGSVKQRYYTQDNIGVSKNIIDPASTCIMIRDLYDDEKTGESRELHVYKLEGKNGKTKIPVKLEKDKRYQILFIIKNREGSANQYQIVVEHDMSRNVMKEVGICNVPIDF
jgi:replicative DNA helicase